jgi:Peptidase A4 family
MAGQRKAPARKAPAKKKEIRLYPPPPQDFDPFAATKRDLMRHGLPLRPDPYKEPGMAALWQRQAERYRGFEHLEPQPDTTTANKKGLPTKIAEPVPAFGPDPIESCGYQLFSSSGNFTALFVTWTVPDLRFSPGQFDAINHFHTFVGLGFLDVHVEMTVDPAQNVTAQLWAQGVGNVNLPVRPGDVISGTLCLDTNGKAAYFFANETTAQTISFAIDTGFPLPSRSTRASLAPATLASRLSSTRWPASASSTSMRSAPSARVAAGRSHRATRSRWSTRTARSSRGRSGSTSSPSRRCSKRRFD